jgi:hypothetical protein
MLVCHVYKTPNFTNLTTTVTSKCTTPLYFYICCSYHKKSILLILKKYNIAEELGTTVNGNSDITTSELFMAITLVLMMTAN